MASSAAQEGCGSALRGSTLVVRRSKAQVFCSTALTEDRVVGKS